MNAVAELLNGGETKNVNIPFAVQRKLLSGGVGLLSGGGDSCEPRVSSYEP
jgi:hypothetical protein